MKKHGLLTLALILATVGTGCATRSNPVATPEQEAPRPRRGIYDPWEPMNRHIYRFNANFDKYVLLPVVTGYRFVLPQFARTGLSNFFTTSKKSPSP